MKTVQPDFIASTALRCGLGDSVEMTDYVLAQEGCCVVVEALTTKQVYNQVEDRSGTFRTVKQGDVFVGVLGERKALKGYSGTVPRLVHAGDTMHVLNMGGIIGHCVSDHPELGPALPVKVLGAVMIKRNGRPVHSMIQDNALPTADALTESAPLVFVSGTAMNTGKTYAACQTIEGLTAGGMRVAAAKATGASLMRDTRAMEEHGAVMTASFTDIGFVSSTNKAMAPATKGIIEHLNSCEPDVIVIELGDGVIGYYGVDDILQDKELQQFTVAHIVTGADLAGIWATRQLFQDRYHARIAAVAGPVTDNLAGRQYIKQILGISAVNAMEDPAGLAAVIKRLVEHPGIEPASGFVGFKQPIMSAEADRS